MEELKPQIEAILFAVGKKMHIDEISKICKKRKQEPVLEALKALQVDYESRQGPVKVTNDGDTWKLGVSERFIPIIQNLGVETELTKSVMETLAVIAWKYPIMQNELIHIRTNKAYDHLSELEKSSFITRQKHGRTRTIRLTEKFFQYFDLPNNKDVENSFKDIVPGNIQDKVSITEEEIVLGEKKAIEIKDKKKAVEAEFKKMKAEQAQVEAGIDIDDEAGKTHHLKEYDNNDDTSAKEVAIEDLKTGEGIELESYGEKKPVIIIEEDKKEESQDLDGLKVYNKNKEEISKEVEEEIVKEEKKKEKVKSVISADEKKVDKIVESILHPKDEEKSEDNKKDNDSEGKDDVGIPLFNDNLNKKKDQESESLFDETIKKDNADKKPDGMKNNNTTDSKSKNDDNNSNDEIKEKSLIDEGGDLPEHVKVESK